MKKFSKKKIPTIQMAKKCSMLKTFSRLFTTLGFPFEKHAIPCGYNFL